MFVKQYFITTLHLIELCNLNCLTLIKLISFLKLTNVITYEEIKYKNKERHKTKITFKYLNCVQWSLNDMLFIFYSKINTQEFNKKSTNRVCINILQFSSNY